MAGTESGVDGKRLGGSLNLLDATAQSVGVIGPVFSIAFLVPLLVGLNASGSGAGTAAPLSVVISAVGVLGLGWIVAEYARRIHAAGSLYDYVTDGLGARAGGAAGLLYYAGILALGSGILVMIGGTVHDTLQSEFGITPLPEVVWDLILLAGLAVVLYLGVALSTRAQLALALVSFTVVLAFMIFVIVQVGPGNQVAAAFSPSGSPQGLGGVFFGVLYGVLLFTGFEAAANLGEETAHPKRDIPRAVLISVLTVAGFYVIGSYAQVAGFHFDLDAVGKNAGAPLFGLAGPVSDGGFGSTAVRRVLELVVVFDMLAVLIGCSVSASRGLFAMARDHRLPHVLSRVSRRGGPLAASLVVLGIGLATILVTALWPDLFAQSGMPHYAAIFSWGSTFGGFALSVIYLLMSVGAIRGLRDHRKPWAVYLACTVGVLVTAAAIFGSVYHVAAPTIYAPYAAIGVFVVGLVVSAVRRPASVPVADS
ncbi:APC family permease [Kutzneria sp. CA-103260]|uniref:APC family permease n=1 Tax=Kutzneria sp. CA-103260 TaxID=2802641 RepID=UPI001BAE0F90|nr:APC family permease [Kutzneria sp. CA-103260]QUQ63806.1 amino acid permease [Kutzneria sp. CA-103260]